MAAKVRIALSILTLWTLLWGAGGIGIYRRWTQPKPPGG